MADSRPDQAYMEREVFYLVDKLMNDQRRWGEVIFSERLGYYTRWTEVPALEEMVEEWSKEHPVLWNVGIGPAASFVRTFTRLLFNRTKDLYGPYDLIAHVRLPTAEAPSSSRVQQHWLAFEFFMEMARTLKIQLRPDDIKELQELKQLAAEESYFGYGTISNNLMLQALGREYIYYFGSDSSLRLDPSYDRQPYSSPILELIKEALQGRRHMLLVENLHVPVSLDVLVLTTGRQRPSPFHSRRWLISTTSKDVYEKSRGARGLDDLRGLHLPPEYYYAPPYDDLRPRDWAMLIKEALWDAAGSIHSTLHKQGDKDFWLHVAQHCLYYGILYHPLQGSATRQASYTSDELIRCWVAEDLISSTARPTKKPESTTQKQCSYYRSAYEAAKVVYRALQEYSLLSNYSSASTSLQQPVIGLSKLAEGVPQLKKDDLIHLEKRSQLGWVSFMNDDGRHVSWNWERKETGGDTRMTSLILRGCSNLSEFTLDQLLTPHLRVLDLSYTPINSLPPSFSSLLNLYLLSLRGCSQLHNLSTPPPTSDKETSPLAHLEYLVVLDMNGVPLLELSKQDGSNKSNLHYLDLSGSKFTTLPTEFFCEMASLEELILSNCTNLKELPPSMAELSNLLVLHVGGTQITSFPEDMFLAMQKLHTLKLTNNILLMSLPRSLCEAKGLKELHLSNCISLRLELIWELVPCLEDLYIETWKSVEGIKIHGHPNLRMVSLSGKWIRCLSLCGCSKLKIVNFSDDLTDLKDVDLSGTALEEVPHNLPNLPQLSTLLLLNVPCFKRFPWHQLVRFPKVFHLDNWADYDNQCQKNFCADANQHCKKTSNAAQITVNDPRMFHSFNSDAANKLVMEGQFLQSFNVQVKQCSVRDIQYSEVDLSTSIQRHSTYQLLQYNSEVANIIPMMKLQPRQRHIEISTKDQYPNGLRHILSVTNSIIITDDNFVRCLTDLNYSLMSLEECQLHRCNQMAVVFIMHSRGSQALPYLKILQVTCLKRLLSLIEPSDLSHSRLLTLKLLKHIHIEDCPRLEKLFPCSLSLPALETLVILFCSNIKTIFYKQPNYEVALSPLPNIKNINLQELPQLHHIHDDVKFQFETPKWEKLFVRGCQSFQRLPLLKKEYLKSKVEVCGEREWWDRLQLKLPEQSDYYLHVPPPEFVSRKKHIIQSYLK